MCAAVPVAVLLLVIFAALTIVRLTGTGSPNADLLAGLLGGCACGARGEGERGNPLGKGFPLSPSPRPPHPLSPS
ncbi:hypothetical protein [Pseudodesulfovibrio indicus]|uniref:Secreted protein n=1 Tax=Pseudodesulfovibrio indicus TaxID=1716143 RepID=A0A126QKL1_9BACT|nr:hypothetical protein [Pseudodesulfovibrio indicus]AMK10188.1 hypothetical protein AWY79_03175 [Pseudodesulfovibrio indicus]TDT87896.1 hypothetical protein EDC59_10791 [Pseudodesulfovibrio indicus]